MLFFLFLACSDAITSQKNEENEEPVMDVQSDDKNRSANNESNTPDEEQRKQEPKPPTDSADKIDQKSRRLEVIPSPKIEGMSTKKRTDKIYAEDFDEYFNKEEKVRPKTVDNSDVVEVKVEENFNAHFNDSNSDILIQVFKDSSAITASMSHDHVIRARGWEGQVIWKPNEPHNCIFEFQLPVHFFDVDPDSFRKKLNLPGIISKNDKKSIYENMMSKHRLARHCTGT